MTAYSARSPTSTQLATSGYFYSLAVFKVRIILGISRKTPPMKQFHRNFSPLIRSRLIGTQQGMHT